MAPRSIGQCATYVPTTPSSPGGWARPEQGESKTGGLPTFIGISVVVWFLVVVLAAAFFGVIAWYATNN